MTTSTGMKLTPNDDNGNGNGNHHDIDETTSTNMSKDNTVRRVVTACPICLGEGKLPSRRRRTKKQKMAAQRNRKHGIANDNTSTSIVPPEPCPTCSSTGVLTTTSTTSSSNHQHSSSSLPRIQPGTHVAICGGGIGGLALALACQHRGIPCTVYEKDGSFDERRQGYGLTVQQGSKALSSLGFGIEKAGENHENKDDFDFDYRRWTNSKRHVVHTPDGAVVGQWGMHVWNAKHQERPKRQNAHVARQELRRMLYEMLLEQGKDTIRWGCRLVSYRELHPDETIMETDMDGEMTENDSIPQQQQQQEQQNEITSDERHNRKLLLTFEQTTQNHPSITHSNNTTTTENAKITHNTTATILVGADGIRSAVRNQKIGESQSPLRYLGCIVVLGIAPSPSSSELTSNGETVFQTADGTTRMYAMPFAEKGKETAGAAQALKSELSRKRFGIEKEGGSGAGDTYDGSVTDVHYDDGNNTHASSLGETMWQLSFPMNEDEAKLLSSKGSNALKLEALKRCGTWHDPIPELLRSTPDVLITGYPVYDRDVLSPELCRYGKMMTTMMDQGNTTENLDKDDDDDNILRGSTSSSFSSISNSSCSSDRVTLIGDAAHPMSPFKGQGANQALLDAVLLARALYRALRIPVENDVYVNNNNNTNLNGRTKRPSIEQALAEYESDMLQRTKVKVEASAEAARFLHSEVAIMEGNITRGAAAATTQK